MTDRTTILTRRGAGLLDQLRGARATERDLETSVRAPSAASCRFTPLQKSLLAAERLFPGAGIANVTKSWRIDGPFDAGAMSRAMGQLVDRHDALRMRVGYSDVQEIPEFSAGHGPELHVERPEGATVRDRIAAADTIIERISRGTTGQNSPYLWSARLFAVKQEIHIFAFAMSHLICDGWSWEVLVRDLFTLYRMETGEACPALPDAASLQDYLAESSQQTLPDQNRDRQSSPEFDWPGPLMQGPGTRHSIVTQIAAARMEPQQFARLARAARAEGCTTFHFLLAAYHLLLEAVCDQTPPGIAVSAADRLTVSREHAIGPFLHLIHSGPDRKGTTNFADFARACRDDLAGAAAAADKPLAFGRAAITYRNYPAVSPDIGGESLRITKRRDPSRAHSTECNLSLQADENGLTARFEGQERLFDGRLLRGMARAYVQILRQVSNRPGIALNDLRFLGQKAAKNQATLAVSPPPEIGHPDVCAKFAEVVTAHRNLPALTTPDTSLTYADLDRITEKLAVWLRNQGLAEGHRLGIALPRGGAVLKVWIAALKAGLTVVPVNVGTPSARLAAQLDEIGCNTLLTDADNILPQNWTGRVILSPDASVLGQARPAPIRRRNQDADRDAVIMFTSGTTGRPKAIPVSHAGILRLTAHPPHLPAGPGDRMSQFAALGFDAALIEIFGAWLSGAELVLCEKPLLTQGGAAAELRLLQPSCAFITSSLFNLIVDTDPGALSSLRHLAVGGEPMSRDHALRALQANPGLQLCNAYGPTENASLTTWHRVSDETGPSVPIGRPLPGNMAFVLTRALKPIPAGFAGELLVGGPGLMRGYDGSARLIENRFVDIPAADLGLEGHGQIRLYKTGDRARRKVDGTLDYLGRRDVQFKFNGNRVEPDEIERVLMEHPGVGRAAVLPLQQAPDGAVSGIAAFFEPRGSGTVDTAALRTFAAARLPRQILPARLEQMDKLPLTGNGKTDRQKLKQLAKDSRGTNSGKPVSSDLLENIWQDLLNRDDIGERDDFFALGGSSLSLVRMLTQVEKAYDTRIDLPLLLADPCLGRLRSLVSSGQTRLEKGMKHLRVLRTGAPDLPPVVILPGLNGTTGWAAEILSRLSVPNSVLSLGFDLPPDGAVPHGFLTDLLQAFCSDLERYRTELPFCLIGFSFSGALVTELAIALEEKGVGIDRLINIDGGCPLPRMTFENSEPDNPLTELKRQRIFLPLRGHAHDVHLITSRRGFPFAPPDKACIWAETTTGRVHEYSIDAEHSRLVHPPAINDVLARLHGVIAGTRAADRHVRGKRDDRLLDAVNVAKRHSAGGDLCLAAQVIEAVIASGDPAPEWIHTSLLDLYQASGATQKARELAEKMANADGSSQTWQALAHPAYGKRIEMLRRCVESSGSNASGAVLLVTALVRHNKPDEARAVAEKLAADKRMKLEASIAQAMIVLFADREAAAAHRIIVSALAQPDAGAGYFLFSARLFLEQDFPGMALDILDLASARIIGPQQRSQKELLTEKARRAMHRPV